MRVLPRIFVSGNNATRQRIEDELIANEDLRVAFLSAHFGDIEGLSTASMLETDEGEGFFYTRSVLRRFQ